MWTFQWVYSHQWSSHISAREIRVRVLSPEVYQCRVDDPVEHTIGKVRSLRVWWHTKSNTSPRCRLPSSTTVGTEFSSYAKNRIIRSVRKRRLLETFWMRTGSEMWNCWALTRNSWRFVFNNITKISNRLVTEKSVFVGATTALVGRRN